MTLTDNQKLLLGIVIAYFVYTQYIKKEGYLPLINCNSIPTWDKCLSTNVLIAGPNKCKWNGTNMQVNKCSNA